MSHPTEPTPTLAPRRDRANGVSAAPPTVLDVAQQAGVSHQTVSRVLNGSPRVALETRSRVLAAMHQLGYSRNQVAGSLRTGRTRTIGLLLANVMNPFTATQLRGVQDTVEQEGYRVVAYNTDADLEKERRYLRVLLEQRVDGALLLDVEEGSESIFRDFAEHGTPVVVLNRLAPGKDSVSIENETSARLATEHLVSHGHRRIGLILTARYAKSRDQRVRGYLAALGAAGVDFGEELIVSASDTPYDARAAVLGLLDVRPRPSAMITGGYLVTLGTLEALAASGLRVPDDVALVATSHISWAPFLAPPLTTIGIDPYIVGVESARILLGRLDGSIQGVPIHTPVSSTFEIRLSCGAHDERNPR